MDLEKKFDLILAELKNICNEIDYRFEKVDARFEQIDKRFEQIDIKFEQIDKRFEQIDARFDKLENRFDNLEKRFDKLEEENKAEHKTMFNMINSLNSAFLRFESEQSNKIDYLLEADKDRKDHQKIYAHEFTKLNDLVAKNSFHISNLEKHFN